MLFLIVKALHIIFVVTWFAALFYIVRLFIYSTEAAQRAPSPEREALLIQFALMQRRLWYGIGWPSSIITLILGGTLLSYHLFVFSVPIGTWLYFKLLLVLGLYLYHDACHRIYKQQAAGVFKYTSLQLRLWNEAATLFLFGIVFAVILREQLSVPLMIVFLAGTGVGMWWAVKVLARRRELK